jgi:hypothetical protein
MQYIPVNPIKHKKFLLALIFGSPNTTQTWLENLGCYSSCPLKKNLFPRFLSVEVESGKGKVRVRLQYLLFGLTDDTLSCVEDLLLL